MRARGRDAASTETTIKHTERRNPNRSTMLFDKWRSAMRTTAPFPTMTGAKEARPPGIPRCQMRKPSVDPPPLPRLVKERLGNRQHSTQRLVLGWTCDLHRRSDPDRPAQYDLLCRTLCNRATCYASIEKRARGSGSRTVVAARMGTEVCICASAGPKRDSGKGAT